MDGVYYREARREVSGEFPYSPVATPKEDREDCATIKAEGQRLLAAIAFHGGARS
jgi:hypothetical protein